MSEEISTTIEDDEEFDKFTDETYQQEVKYRQILNKIEFTLKEKNTRKNSDNEIETGKKSKTVSLPKIIIKKFHGDPTEWQSFHQSFDEGYTQKFYFIKR